MKISEVIEALEEVKSIKGDLDVAVRVREWGRTGMYYSTNLYEDIDVTWNETDGVSVWVDQDNTE